MSPVEKIKVIKRISKKLSKEEFGVINLILKQFKFSASKSLTGDSFSYVLKKIQNGQNSQLQKLDLYLRDHDEDIREIKPSFWKEDFFKLFISHASGKKETATRLRQELENFGISGFVAHNDIRPSKKWHDEMELALQTCDALTALLSKSFHDSNWTDQEVGFVYGRNVLIIPVNMGVVPYGFMSKFQAYKYRDVAQLCSTIFESLIANDETKKQMAYAVIRNFELSDSFARARKNMKLVKKIKFWDTTLLSRLKQAQENNRQIRESIGVPQSIDVVLKRVKKIIE